MNTTSQPNGCNVMYCDRDSRGLYSIIGLTRDQLDLIRRALTAYRIGMVCRKQVSESASSIKFPEQYERAGDIVHRIESSL